MRTPEDALAFIERCRASAILRVSDASLAAPAMEAAVRGGFRVVEFTLTTPGALDRVSDFAARDGLLVGAGTVLTVEQVRDAVKAGARFIVSPVVDEAVVEEALALGALAMPGCHTPTELLRAHRAGAQLQKLFPAPADGPAFIRACLGPLPFLRIVPTNGVTAQNVRAHLAAGAFACGFVAPLFDPQLLARRDWRGVEQRARAILQAADVEVD